MVKYNILFLLLLIITTHYNFLWTFLLENRYMFLIMSLIVIHGLVVFWTK
jgi:hypothetical protein